MRRALLAAAMVAMAGAAWSAPPPAGSPDDEAMKPYGGWIKQQQVPHIGGACCDSSDGRMVDARVNGKTGRWEVRFVHPEEIDQPNKPEVGRWYDVPNEAVLHSENPSGIPVAWWYPELSVLQHGSPIRCFAPASGA